MKVYILEETHRAEGSGILAIFTTSIAPEKAISTIDELSDYANSERREWCTYSYQEWLVKDVNCLDSTTGWKRTIWLINFAQQKLYTYGQDSGVEVRRWP